MQIAVLKESALHEKRVALSPAAVQMYLKKGFEVIVERGAGNLAHISDEQFIAVGAKIAANAVEALKDAHVVLKVAPPTLKETDLLEAGKYLVCIAQPMHNAEVLKKLLAKKVNVFALERIPRTSRAQSMDVLSSQANLVGYKSVLDAIEFLPRAVPMMMTAAGTIKAAKIMVMGVGVAGLQAIATAKRLGAIVSATDVRPSTKEQVESLGAKFVAVEDEEFKDAQSSTGYAKAMSEAYMQKQNALVRQVITEQDIVICAALVPNRKAPVLIDDAMVKSMKKGSVIVDLAVSAGGNCSMSQYGKVVCKEGVHILGYSNVASMVAQTASELLAKNMVHFVELLSVENNTVQVDIEDDILDQTLLFQDGVLRAEDWKAFFE